MGLQRPGCFVGLFDAFGIMKRTRVAVMVDRRMGMTQQSNVFNSPDRPEPRSLRCQMDLCGISSAGATVSRWPRGRHAEAWLAGGLTFIYLLFKTLDVP